MLPQGISDLNSEVLLVWSPMHEKLSRRLVPPDSPAPRRLSRLGRRSGGGRARAAPRALRAGAPARIGPVPRRLLHSRARARSRSAAASSSALCFLCSSPSGLLPAFPLMSLFACPLLGEKNTCSHSAFGATEMFCVVIAEVGFTSLHVCQNSPKCAL